MHNLGWRRQRSHEKHHFHIFPSRGGRFNKVSMSMTNIGEILKASEGVSETTFWTSQLFTWDVSWAALALRPSAIVKILAQAGVFIFWGSVGPPSVLYICLPSLLPLSGLSLCLPVFLRGGAELVFSFVLQLFPTCISQCLGFFVLQSWSSLEHLALSSNCSLELSFVSQYVHICVSVSAVLWCRWCCFFEEVFGGFCLLWYKYICLIAEHHTHKESNSPIHLHSTGKDQWCSVAVVGVSVELICIALASRCWPIETSRTAASSKLLSPVQKVSFKTVNLGLF